MTIAERILNYKVDNRLTRKEFAKKIGYSEKTVAGWEKKQLPMNAYQYEDLATLLNVPVDELKGGLNNG